MTGAARRHSAPLGRRVAHRKTRSRSFRKAFSERHPPRPSMTSVPAPSVCAATRSSYATSRRGPRGPPQESSKLIGRSQQCEQCVSIRPHFSRPSRRDATASGESILFSICLLRLMSFPASHKGAHPNHFPRAAAPDFPHSSAAMNKSPDDLSSTAMHHASPSTART